MTGRVRCVLLDIEGTIAPIAFVHEVLFPYARRELPSFLQQHAQSPEVIAARRQVAVDAGGAPFTDEQLLEHLRSLMDRDAKTTGLKLLQGLIWDRAFRTGALKSALFPDVAPAMRRWHAQGITLRIYSSGSVAAQRAFLAHTSDGDLTPLLSAYYDTSTGPKRAPDSYSRIASDAGADPHRFVFVSDVPAELDAAALVGMQTRLALRPGNPDVGPTHHDTIRSFDQPLVECLADR